jgi:hypothetical protein
MARPYRPPRSVVTWAIGGATVLVVCGSPVVLWVVARRAAGSRTNRPHPAGAELPASSSGIDRITHNLRQVFTVLLLSIGSIRRKILAGDVQAALRIAERLRQVVDSGIHLINELDPPDRSQSPQPRVPT